jgi:hypothetical protein
MVCALAAVALLGGCGGSDEGGAGEPADAISAYLTAVADNEGQRACDLLTVKARAQIVEVGGNSDCPALVDTFHTFLGADAERLKGAEVKDVSIDGDMARASVELEGQTAEVELKRVGDEWRIDTFGFAGSLLGVVDGGSTSVSAEAAEACADKWCEVQPGMTLSEADEIMGEPTGVFQGQHQWEAFQWHFTAFANSDGTIRQLDSTEDGSTTETSSVPCGDPVVGVSDAKTRQ